MKNTYIPIPGAVSRQKISGIQASTIPSESGILESTEIDATNLCLICKLENSILYSKFESIN